MTSCGVFKRRDWCFWGFRTQHKEEARRLIIAPCPHPQGHVPASNNEVHASSQNVMLHVVWNSEKAAHAKASPMQPHFLKWPVPREKAVVIILQKWTIPDYHHFKKSLQDMKNGPGTKCLRKALRLKTCLFFLSVHSFSYLRVFLNMSYTQQLGWALFLTPRVTNWYFCVTGLLIFGERSIVSFLWECTIPGHRIQGST